jgi:hypothetical protein
MPYIAEADFSIVDPFRSKIFSQRARKQWESFGIQFFDKLNGEEAQGLVCRPVVLFVVPVISHEAGKRDMSFRHRTFGNATRR